MMEVQSQTASLETLSVTIQALHVNNKQMTLAVFRQLPAHDVLDAAGEFDKRLRPWGWVRYSIKDDADEWAVCQLGTGLVRCALRSPTLSYYEGAHESARENLEKAKAKAEAGFMASKVYLEQAVMRAIEAFARAENELDMVVRERAATARVKAATPQLFIAV